jgi:hypothetical protein
MREIPLHSRKYSGLVAWVDDEDYERTAPYRWFPAKRRHTFYAAAYLMPGDPAQTLLHRFILPVRGQIDHVDGNGLNCQKHNMRSGEQYNPQNSRLQGNNTSGYVGVVWREDNRNWVARITLQNKSIHVGTYADPIEAAHARDDAARKLHGEFARLNFPNEGERGVKLCQSSQYCW